MDDPGEPKRCPDCGGRMVSGTGPLLCPACVLSDPELDHESLPDVPRELRRFGGYTLLGEVARGGMGVVFRARQDGLNRIVALKVLPGAAFVSAEFRVRFQREAETAARLHHPGIVAIHEIGEVKGQPFISMDLIEGESLAARLAASRITPEFAAHLVREVARAVDHAHRHGVAHRDLKPSNILLTPDNQPVLTDFGLARFLDPAAHSGVTVDLLGSPPYLPPERIGGETPDNPVAEDVYGLGAILYHGLTGRPPFLADTIHALLAAVGEGSPVAPRRLNRSVPQDLETICLKCLELQPGARYPTAAAVADELDRFLRGDAIHARPLAPAEQFIRLICRKPLTSSLVLMLVASLAAGTIASAWGWRRAARTAAEARAAAEQRRVELYSGKLAAATAAMEAGNRNQALRLLRECLPASGESDLRGPEWFLLNHLLRPNAIFSEPAHTHILTSLAWSPSGDALLTASHDGSIRWWNCRSNTIQLPARTLKISDKVRIHQLAWLPQGEAYLSAEGNVIRCRTPDRDAPLWEIPGSQFSLAADGRTLAVSTGGPFFFEPPGKASIWKLADDRPSPPVLQKQLPESARAIAISPDARWLAIGLTAREHTDDSTNLLLTPLDPSAGPVRTLETGASVWTLGFSSDSKSLAATTIAAEGRVRVFDAASGNDIPFPHVHTARLGCASFVPGTGELLTASSDRSLAVTSPDGSVNRLPFAHDNEIWAAAIHPSGKFIASGDKDGTLKLHPWPLPPDPATSFPAHDHFRYHEPVFTRDNHSLLVCEALPVWRTVSWNPADDSIIPQSHPFHPLGITADGWTLHLDPATGVLDQLNPGHAARRYTFPGDCVPLKPGRHHSAVSPDGGHVALFSESGHATRLDTATGEMRSIREFCQETPLASGLSPGGRFLVATTWTQLRLHDFQSGKTTRLSNDPHWAKAIAFSPDGKLLITGGADSHLVIRRLPELTVVTELRGHLTEVSGLALSPDGKTLVSSEIGSGLRFWRLDTWQQVLRLPLPTACENLAFSQDGQLLAVATCPPATPPTKARVIVIPCPRD